MFDEIFKTLEKTQMLMEETKKGMSVQQKIHLIEFIVQMCLQYNKKPEEIIKLFVDVKNKLEK